MFRFFLCLSGQPYERFLTQKYATHTPPTPQKVRRKDDAASTNQIHAELRCETRSGDASWAVSLDLWRMPIILGMSCCKLACLDHGRGGLSAIHPANLATLSWGLRAPSGFRSSCDTLSYICPRLCRIKAANMNRTRST